MQRIKAISLEASTGKAHDLLSAVNNHFGKVPMIFQTMAQSPTVLEAYLGFNSTLTKGDLSHKLAEQIAVSVANQNHCDYCASAHTALGKGAGLSADELNDNLEGRSSDTKTQAVLNFCNTLVENRGDVEDVTLNEIRAAGFSDGQILEMIAHVALNTFTNYFNLVAQTEIDFDKVSTAAFAS